DDAAAAELRGVPCRVDGHGGHGIRPAAVEDVVDVELDVVLSHVRPRLGGVVDHRIDDGDGGRERAVGACLHGRGEVELADGGDDVDGVAAGVVARFDLVPAHRFAHGGKVARQALF